MIRTPSQVNQSDLTLQVETPFLPEMQMLFLLMFKGNSTAQARLVMVSTVASLSTGLMLSAWSVGFPAFCTLISLISYVNIKGLTHPSHWSACQGGTRCCSTRSRRAGRWAGSSLGRDGITNNVVVTGSHLWTQLAREDGPVRCRYECSVRCSSRGWKSHWRRSLVFHPPQSPY